METRRLRMLVELDRFGSMRAVADVLGTTTSTVSQQIAVLGREAGTDLVEPVGRRVRLTPAGRRLAEHGVTILAAVEAARLDLDPGAEPAGTLQVAGCAGAIRRSLLPIVADLAISHPDVALLIREHEPGEALELLDDASVDLALVYDYDLAPRAFDRRHEVTPLWTAEWGLGVPADSPPVDGSSLAVVAHHREHPWIVNSRNTADEQVVRTLASMAGCTPRIAHRADSLELVEELVVAGLGVGLLPMDMPLIDGVRLVPLADPGVALRYYAVVRRGHAEWPPLALLLDELARRPPRAPGITPGITL